MAPDKSKRSAKLGAALIGVGDISALHVPGYLGNPDCELRAICDANASLLARRKEEWGVKNAYADYREALADPSVDLVEILTPHELHAEMTEAAAAAGKHISVQKPMSVSLAEADRMIAAARKAGVKLRVFENFVFYPPYVKAKELIEAGEIGEPLAVRFKLGTCLGGTRQVPLASEIWHLLEVEKGRGQAVFDDGWHKLSQAIDLFGEIEAVQGWVDRSFGYVDMPGLLMWRYKDSGCLGHFDLAFSPNLYCASKYFSPDERIEITGSKGSIAVTRCTALMMDAPSLILSKNGRRILFDDLRADWQDSFTDSTRHFIRCIAKNETPRLTGERGKHVTQFAFACILAGKTGGVIRPKDLTDEMIAQNSPSALGEAAQ